MKQEYYQGPSLRCQIFGGNDWGNFLSKGQVSLFRDNVHPVTHQPGAAQLWPCPTLGQFWKTIPAPTVFLELGWGLLVLYLSLCSRPTQSHSSSPSPWYSFQERLTCSSKKFTSTENSVCNSLLRIYKVISPTRKGYFCIWSSETLSNTIYLGSV